MIMVGIHWTFFLFYDQNEVSHILLRKETIHINNDGRKRYPFSYIFIQTHYITLTSSRRSSRYAPSWPSCHFLMPHAAPAASHTASSALHGYALPSQSPCPYQCQAHGPRWWCWVVFVFQSCSCCGIRIGGRRDRRLCCRRSVEWIKKATFV